MLLNERLGQFYNSEGEEIEEFFVQTSCNTKGMLRKMVIERGSFRVTESCFMAFISFKPDLIDYL